MWQTKYVEISAKDFSRQGETMSKREEFKKSFLRLLVFGLTFGVFAFQANAQRNNSSGLTGSYQIDTRRSENVSDIVESATKNSSVNSDQKEDLEDKLDAPESVTIDIRGDQVTLSSTVTRPVTFTADGRMQTTANTRIRATLRNNSLKIVSLGGDTDYTITFASIDNGKGLEVTRMVTTNYLSQTVFADSYYNKTSSYADNKNRTSDDTGSNDDGYSSSDSSDDDYSSSDPNDKGNSNKNPKNNRNSPRTTTRSGDFYVANGTVLTGTLGNRITTKASQNNDRFTMTVESPSEYRGAVIKGYLSGIQRTGKVTGKSKITFNFETIRLRNGQSYDFAGVLQKIVDTQGKSIKINDEGEVKGKSRTKETAKRGGIGAGLGAIIGGIIGGGKGAIIGATIGGSAGAGSVAIEGKDDLELEQGSQITVQSTSPDKK